jgi:hypothetical protein
MPSRLLQWMMPAGAIVAVVALVIAQLDTLPPRVEAESLNTPLAPPAQSAPPDISSMSPDERADRLFDRVMRLVSEGKRDSATFFAPMAMSALEALAPLDAHRHYDLGLVALVSGDLNRASADVDAILKVRPNHLLGLTLAAKLADARNDAGAAAEFRRRLVAAEAAEIAAALPEYAAHAADIREAVAMVRKIPRSE